MTFRTRVLLAFAPIVLVPLLVFGLGVRRVVGERLTAQFQARVQALVQAIRRDLERESGAIAARLAAVREAAQGDNRFRVAAVQGALAERPYLLDYAGAAMRFADLDMLQIQDEAGRILSSGHFRNQFDQVDRGLPRALARAPGAGALVRTRTPESSMLVLARLDTLRLGGRGLTLVGGVDVRRRLLAALAPEPDIAVALVTPEDSMEEGVAGGAPPGSVVAELELPYVAATGDAQVARIVVAHSLESLAALRRDTDLWFLAAVLVSAAAALVLAGWLASRVTRPLSELAARTAALDLERLDARFGSDRPDEVGTLARLLGEMVERLKAGAARLREFERRAAMGDLARQVNHDIKNGLAPLRNVFRHLVEVAAERPADLPRVLAERRGTVESSIGYLEGLAANYARLYPETAARPVDVNQVVQETLRHFPERAGVMVAAELQEGVPKVRGDALVIRRILENLVANALDALGDRGGRVTVATARTDGAAGGTPGVRLTVADTGRGMTRAELDRAFDDFYTTKPGGTGLGLSIVRRLVLDLEGRLKVETEPGQGTRFMVELPGSA